MMEHTCCFFGHRKVELTEEQNAFLNETIERLITEEKVDTFIFGSKSEFDKLCYKVVSEWKSHYTHIKRIYMSIYRPYPGESTESYHRGYEETRHPEKLDYAGKATYVLRNQMMIDESNFCVVYFDADYQPPKPRQKNSFLPAAQPKSGTKVAYDYAVKKEKSIINIFKTHYPSALRAIRESPLQK